MSLACLLGNHPKILEAESEEDGLVGFCPRCGKQFVAVYSEPQGWDWTPRKFNQDQRNSELGTEPGE